MYVYNFSFDGFDDSAKLNNLFHQATKKQTETLAEVESSENDEQALIFSRPKHKSPSKPTVSRKITTQKTIPLEETTTSTVGPPNKGNRKQTGDNFI